SLRRWGWRGPVPDDAARATGGSSMTGPKEPVSPSDSTDAADADPLVGQVLGGRYRVLRPIAVGGMATIYAARHSMINRPVAIKLLHPEFAHDPDCVERFANEGRAAGALGHPNIVESLDMGSTSEGMPFLVLELLDGVGLHDTIKNDGAFPLERAAHIALQ